MKKVLALLLAVVMVIGMSTMAMAAGELSDHATATFTVKFTKTGDGTCTETFNFSTPEFDSVDAATIGLKDDGTPVTEDDCPTFGAITPVELTAGGADGQVVINLPAVNTFPAVGKYIYKFKETVADADAKAGIEYDTRDIYLVVTIVRDADGTYRYSAIHCEGDATADGKTSEIENKYTNGTLTVKKVVDGNLGDKNKYFDFTATFASDAAIDTSTITITGASNPRAQWDGNVVSFKLKSDDTITFGNVPTGVSYTVAETNENTEGYTTSYDGKQTGDITENVTSATVVTNVKDETIDTGIVLDSLPYILIGVAVAAAAVLMVAKKRRIED